MNNERRNELIALLRNTINACERCPTPSNVHVPAACRDILAMLEADAAIDRISQKLADGDTELEYRPNSVAFKRAAPSITFKPLVPERVTLDQMPEHEPHLVTRSYIESVERPIEYRMRVGDEAPLVDRQGKAVGGCNPPKASAYVVVDIDAAEPKTLADVPSDIFCVDDGGDMAVRVGSSVYMLADERFGRINKLAEDIPITRVLGTPVVNLVGDEEAKEPAETISRLNNEIRAYDIRMGNDAKTIADLRAKLAQGAI